MTARDLLPDDADATEASRARLCGGCGEWSKWKHGFGRCAQMDPWQLVSERASCAFTPVRWAEITPEMAAKRDAQAGIDQAVAAADHQHAGWSDTALEFVKLYALQHRGERYIGHDIVEASKAKGVIQPGNTRAWGGPIQRAARAGLIKRVGFAPDPNRHTNPVPLWESA